MTPLSNEDMWEISNSLEDYHSIFYAFWTLSSIGYSNNNNMMPTACVQAVPGGKARILLNREFWNKLSKIEKVFVIIHECLHIILKHLSTRNGLNVFPNATHIQINVAQDITINEMAATLFGFDRSDLGFWKTLCWIDTVFPGDNTVKKNQTFLYYLEKILENNITELPETLDDHESFEDSEDSIGQQSELDELAETLIDELSDKEIQAVNQVVSDQKNHTDSNKVVYNRKKDEAVPIDFKKIVNGLARNSFYKETQEYQSYVMENRRFSDIIARSNVSLEGTHERDVIRKSRLLTAVFMDISGSCISHLPEFNKIFDAFHKHESTFDLTTYGFDSKVIKMKKGQRVRAGGSTDFIIIDEQLEKIKKEKGKFPDCVVVITDGEGCRHNPEKPKNWIWVLTGSKMTDYIHKDSKIFDINKIIW